LKASGTVARLLDLIGEVVKTRVKENLTRAAAKKRARSGRRTGGATKVASKVVSKRRRVAAKRSQVIVNRAADYVALLSTHSDHRLCPAERLQALLAAVRAAIDAHGGRVPVDYVAVSCWARRE
jgi:hypothetical protein